MSKLYHESVYMPKKIRSIPERICTFYAVTMHAKESAKNDRLGQINIPSEVYFSGKEIVECEILSNGLKFVVRLPYNKDNDIMYCILYDSDGCATLKTVWLNNMWDSHTTLDKSKYIRKVRNEF